MNLDLKGKLGKFPVWVWGVFVAVAGLAIYFIYNRKTNSANDTATTTLSGSGYQTAGINDDTRGNNNSIVSTDNNQAWLSRAAKAVSDLLAVSPSSVYGALQKWLSGQDLTSQEKTWVDKALQTIGNPPESVQGTSNVLPDPPAKPGGGTTTTPTKTLTSLTRSISSANHTVYAHWSDGTTTWVSAAQVAQLAAQKPITDTLSSGKPIDHLERRSSNGTVFAVDASGNKEWVSAGAMGVIGNKIRTVAI